jgi:hypothetical protein
LQDLLARNSPSQSLFGEIHGGTQVNVTSRHTRLGQGFSGALESMLSVSMLPAQSTQLDTLTIRVLIQASTFGGRSPESLRCR